MTAALDAIRALAAAATPGPWEDHTFGHRSVRSAAGAVTKALFAVPVDSGVRLLMTDLSWVQTDDLNIALVGNGPNATENAAYIAAVDPQTVLGILAALDRAEAALRWALDTGRWPDTPADQREWAAARAALDEVS